MFKEKTWLRSKFLKLCDLFMIVNVYSELPTKLNNVKLMRMQRHAWRKCRVLEQTAIPTGYSIFAGAGQQLDWTKTSL
ncbi:MAG: hypothetical protein VR78_18140 [Hoeflea sp. BRH_c9]|nr:MAG: hypothetical protein VR78_18140 [Hoeflea sp. BRH_c9]